MAEILGEINSFVFGESEDFVFLWFKELIDELIAEVGHIFCAVAFGVLFLFIVFLFGDVDVLSEESDEHDEFGEVVVVDVCGHFVEVVNEDHIADFVFFVDFLIDIMCVFEQATEERMLVN